MLQVQTTRSEKFTPKPASTNSAGFFDAVLLMKSEPKKRGRKPKWTPEQVAGLKAQILAFMAQGESLVEVCKRRAMPSERKVFTWLASDKGFEQNYAEARAAQAHLTYRQIEDVERRMLLPPMLPNPDYDAAEALKCRENKVNYAVPYELPNPDFINDRIGRVLIDSLKWRLARQDPKRFGDRVGIDHSGQVKHTHVKDEAPDWMQDEIAEKAGKEPPARPAAAAKTADQGKATVH